MCRNAMIVMIASSLLAGCATPVYKEVMRKESPYNVRSYPVSAEALYQATIKAVCSKGFILEREDKADGFILGKRYFQRGKKNIVLALQAKIVPPGETASSIYLSAVETTENLYVADRTRFFLFLIPLPGGGGKQATTIKEGERMVEDKRFYKEFFSLIEQELGIAGKKAQ